MSSNSKTSAQQERILAQAAAAGAAAGDEKGGKEKRKAKAKAGVRGRLGVDFGDDDGGGAAAAAAAAGGSDVYNDDGGAAAGGGGGGGSSDGYESYTGSEYGSDEEPDTPRTAARKAGRRQWDLMFEECSLAHARALSRAEREEKVLTHASLAYGEPTFDAIWDLFLRLDELGERPPPGTGNMYDLGAGTGRAALAAVLAHDFHKARGVELLEGLHGASIGVLERFNGLGLPGLSDAKLRTDVRFLCGDLRDTSWEDATFVVASWACFNEQLVRHVTRQARDVRPGCLFVAVTKPLDDPLRWSTLDEAERRMSWGVCTVYIHKRRTADEERAYRSEAAREGGGGGELDDDEDDEQLRPTAYPSRHRVGTRYKTSSEDDDG